MSEKHYRSMSKSIIWRFLGIAILAIVTYAYTRSWIQTGLITFLHHLAFIFIFYFHERVWLKIKWPKTLKWRSVAKMFTYETILGNVVLGIISLAVTGSWKQMTQITITYIAIKHIVYIFNEFVWDRIKWGKSKDDKGLYKKTM
jgi:uncharacterized membrane protein